MIISNSIRRNSGHHPARIGTLIIPTDPYWIQALEAVVRTAHEFGDELVYLQPASTMEDMDALAKDDLVELVLAHELDALISTGLPVPVLEALLAAGLPMICLAEVPYDHPLYTCMFSLYQGGKMAGEYIGQALQGKGHALCVWAGLEKFVTKGKERLTGFQDALKDYPDISVQDIPAYWSYARAYPVLKKALEHYRESIDALFGVSDTIMLAARDVGLELGIVDDHTVLVGLNGDAEVLAGVADGSIAATVDIASEKLGAAAMLIAHQTAQGQPQARYIPQEFQLITRQNLGTIATHKLAAIASVANRMVGYNRMQEQNRLTQLEISMQINRQVGSLLERQEMFKTISQLVEQYYGYVWMCVLRWSEKESRLIFYEGSLSPAMQATMLEQDELVRHVFETKIAVYIPDTRVSHRWQGEQAWQGIRSRAVLPIPLGNKVIGVLDLHAKHPVLNPSLETIGLELLASQLGIAIQNADLYLEALQAREVAERANQLKTRLIANVGHEMRTPLNAILGFSQGIQKTAEAGTPIPNEQLKQDVHHIYASGEHLMYMINDLLDLSRAEIGALNLVFEPIQPETFLCELFENFTRSTSYSLPEPGSVRWELDIREQLPVIRADAVRLRQILTNLLVNAAKFTRRGVIRLGAQVDLPYLHIWVEDSGPGVPLEIQEKIFEPFNTSRSRRRPEGIGLGLSITRHLVSLHEGLLTLESQPGVGSVFHVYLPLPGILSAQGHGKPSECQSLMLVISEAAEIPSSVRQMAQRQGLEVRRAANPDELAQALSAGAPAAVVWDLGHASAVEWGLVNRLGASPHGAALPVILYNGDVTQAGAASGLTRIVFKPCEANALKDWISQMDGNLSLGANQAILVVDDDPQARDFYRGILQTGFPHSTVVCVNGGCQALAWLADQTPALIVLDLMMPDVDGFQVLAQVRSEARTRQVPVVVVSGKLLTFDDIQQLNYSRTALLTKELFTEAETAAFLGQVQDEAALLPQPTSQLVKQSLAFLHQHFSEPLSRKEIAEAVGVSENYLSQIFRQEMTITPWDYLNRYRIQKAKILLLEGCEKVTVIAGKVGFNDSAYFSRVFRSHTGKSPQEYRNNAR